MTMTTPNKRVRLATAPVPGRGLMREIVSGARATFAPLPAPAPVLPRTTPLRSKTGLRR